MALGIAKAHGARFLLASTSEVYGDPHVHPQTEDYWGNVNPVGERSMYDEAKRFAEAMTMAYHREHGVNTHIVRIFNTYGERMRLDDGRVLPNFVGQALRGEPLTVYGDGGQTRSVLLRVRPGGRHLPAADERIPHAGEYRQPGRNHDSGIRRGDTASDGEQVRLSCRSRCRRTTPSSGSRTSPWPSTLLGWNPKVGREEGLRRTLEYFRGKTVKSA